MRQFFVLLAALLWTSCGASWTSAQSADTSAGNLTPLKVQTIQVRRGPVFNTHRPGAPAASPAPRSPSDQISTAARWTIDSQNSTYPTQLSRPGSEVLVNEAPSSTMIQHPISGPGVTPSASHPKYLSPVVRAQASDSIARELAASQVYADGWSDTSSCCPDPWAGMCPCREDHWDCPCCTTSKFCLPHWLVPGRCNTGCADAAAHQPCPRCHRHHARAACANSGNSVGRCDAPGHDVNR